VAYYVYAPVVTKLFKTDAPKILGLHAVLHSSLTEKVNNPYLFYKRYGPYVTIANFLQSHLLKNGFSDFDALHWISPAEPFLKHRNIYQIPNWVDTESFNKRKDEKKEFCVLFLGRQTYAKGFDRFLETARLLKNQISFISTGKTVENIKGLGFFPYASLNSLYSKASVVISPTRDDSFGITIVESLAAGVPVITTPLLSHTSLSLPLLYAESPSEIAAKVKELYALWKNDKEKYDHICRLGIESAKKYDAKTALPRIEQMLLEVSKR
jgi:glycosyltransferase involved in cell wall biosynthesis